MPAVGIWNEVLAAFIRSVLWARAQLCAWADVMRMVGSKLGGGEGGCVVGTNQIGLRILGKISPNSAKVHRSMA